MRDISETIGSVDTTALKQSFIDSMSREDFRFFVNGLNIDYEILMKYTSSLEDCLVEDKACRNCPGVMMCKNRVAGYKYTPIKDGKIINFSYVMCDKKREVLERLQYQNNMQMFDMPKDILYASFQNVYRDDKRRIPVLKYFKEFIDDYGKKDVKGVFLNGSFGAGKTYLVASLFNEMAKRGVKSILVYYPELLRSLKAAFQNGGEFRDKFEAIKKVQLLLLDDIGAENCTVWSRDEILGPILQYRMENHLPTFFTSNLNIEELEDFMAITNSGVDKIKSRRIIERIKQLSVPIELISQNRRG